jgi:hypothetical protein
MKSRSEKKYRNRKTGKKTGGAKRKTMKHGRKIDNVVKSRIVKVFIELLNMIKLYHWKTRSFSQHKATDELYEKMGNSTDTFVEIMMGKDESRIKMLEKRIDLLDESNTRDFKQRIYEYREFLTDMNMYFNEKKDTDLLNIRDEILGHVNQFLYLLTLDK